MFFNNSRNKATFCSFDRLRYTKYLFRYDSQVALSSDGKPLNGAGTNESLAIDCLCGGLSRELKYEKDVEVDGYIVAVNDTVLFTVTGASSSDAFCGDGGNDGNWDDGSGTDNGHDEGGCDPSDSGGNVGDEGEGNEGNGGDGVGGDDGDGGEGADVVAEVDDDSPVTDDDSPEHDADFGDNAGGRCNGLLIGFIHFV